MNIFVKMNGKRVYNTVLSVCTTLLWGLPALYVSVMEFIALIIFLARAISEWSWDDTDYPLMIILFLLVANLVLAAVVCVWIGNRKLKLASSVFFFALSLLLIPISFVSASYGSFMNGFTGEHVAFQYSSVAAILAFPLAGMLLSILSFIKYYREKTPKSVFLVVKSVIDELDVYGLLEGGAPSNEFDIESREISHRISKNHSPEKIASVIAKVFNKYFDLHSRPSEYIKAATKIKELLLQKEVRDSSDGEDTVS